ncbi:zinc finger RNA-binding protein-like [Cochliomyia hominivorax]
MSFEFLQNYNIPPTRRSTGDYYGKSQNDSTMEGAYGTYSLTSIQDTPTVNTAYYGYGGSNYYSENYVSNTTTPNDYYQNPERFIPPAKHGTGYVPQKPAFKRKSKSVNGGSPAKKVAPIEEVTSDGKLVMFFGRDESYPGELNKLIHPLSCDLCNVKMNSKTIAKDHYESKVHDKHISAWLFKNYTEKGINPPEVKRFIKQGPSGPDAFYCEHCDLKLTSITHANQHYAGKKHRLVVAQRAKPSGAGFYNSEGKWVRTGTKVTPSHKDRRFGIGDSFKYAQFLKSSENDGYLSSNNEKAATTVATTTITTAADTTTNTEANLNSMNASKNILPTEDAALFCSICKVSVTSAVQMTMHLSGSKHMKKLKLAGIDPGAPGVNVETVSDIIPPAGIINDNVLLSAIKEEIKPDPNDLSMYRTPSGQYYCKTCNTSMSHLPALEQHLKGKRHLKKLTEDKAKAALAAKKSKV